MNDGWKTPLWDDTPITITKRLLQECELALSEVRGLVQRLESHDKSGCCKLDARDIRALEWGREALMHLREVSDKGVREKRVIAAKIATARNALHFLTGQTTYEPHATKSAAHIANDALRDLLILIG